MSHALKAAIEDAVKSARAVAERAVEESRELTETEKAEFNAYMEKARDTQRVILGFAERKSELEEFSADLGTDVDDAEEVVSLADKRGNAKAGRTKDNRRQSTIGAQFVESPEYQTMLANAPNGRFSEKARVQSQPHQIKALLTGASDTSAGALVNPQLNGLLDPYYARPLTVRQLVTNGRTTSDKIDFVRMINTDNNAAPVAEATTEGVIDPVGPPIITPVQGGLKPQSGFEFEKDSTSVSTLAHWMAATKRALSDAAQVRTLIDNFLRTGLEEVLEDQMLNGDGTGESFTGITNTSGVQLDTGVGGAITSVEAARRARRKVQIGGRTTPTAYLFHPIDWEEIELLRDTQQRFYGNGPFAMGPSRLWGLPVVESEALIPGEALCGDFRQAILWDREDATIQVTDSHMDYFVRNLVAILAELRAAFAVLRPAAFCKITLT